MTPPNSEFSLDCAKEVCEEISKNLPLDNLAEDVGQMLMKVLPLQARFPLSRVLTDITMSRFVIVQVEVMATRTADDDDAHNGEE